MPKVCRESAGLSSLKRAVRFPTLHQDWIILTFVCFSCRVVRFCLATEENLYLGEKLLNSLYGHPDNNDKQHCFAIAGAGELKADPVRCRRSAPKGSKTDFWNMTYPAQVSQLQKRRVRKPTKTSTTRLRATGMASRRTVTHIW